MKTSLWISLLGAVLLCLPVTAQYYLRGEVKDAKERPLQGVRITLAAKPKQVYYSGANGAFGIPATLSTDTIYLELEGYEKMQLLVNTKQFQRIVLPMLPATARLYDQYRASITSNHKDNKQVSSNLGESYSNIIENGFVNAKQASATSFSLNIDNAAYSNIRRFINNGMRIPVDAIRIEEMLNYFNFPLKGTSVNQADTGFQFSYAHTTSPWNENNQLLFLQCKAPTIALEEVPPTNLVFLIDISGSMDKPNRLPLLQSAFRMLVDNLREKDTISVVTYGGGVGVALPPTGGAHKQAIRKAVDSLQAGGDTPGAGAIQMAYEMARKNLIRGGNNRVILATDGDFNVGQISENELEELIVHYKETGIYLTCLGVGMGNYKDSKLETLSKRGNGNFAYIDQLREAEKVLVTEFTKNMYTVANDASIHIAFDPNLVESYRLIGFDNKKQALENGNTTLEGGEIGSGHHSMAILEIKPVKRISDTLAPLATVTLQYKQPGNTEYSTQTFQCAYQPQNIQTADSIYRTAAAIALFGSVLRNSPHTRQTSLETVQTLALSGIDTNDVLQQELQTLIERAIQLYMPNNKKKKK